MTVIAWTLGESLKTSRCRQIGLVAITSLLFLSQAEVSAQRLLEEVVVLATRRAESAADLPVVNLLLSPSDTVALCVNIRGGVTNNDNAPAVRGIMRSASDLDDDVRSPERFLVP